MKAEERGRPGAGNLFANIETRSAGEIVAELAVLPGVKIERIVSTGQTSPTDGSWYDQPWTEWVALIAGAAVMEFEGESAPRALKPGDHLLIPPHCRHRVAWTDPQNPTVWLAVHIGADHAPSPPARD